MPKKQSRRASKPRRAKTTKKSGVTKAPLRDKYGRFVAKGKKSGVTKAPLRDKYGRFVAKGKKPLPKPRRGKDGRFLPGKWQGRRFKKRTVTTGSEIRKQFQRRQWENQGIQRYPIAGTRHDIYSVDASKAGVRRLLDAKPDKRNANAIIVYTDQDGKTQYRSGFNYGRDQDELIRDVDRMLNQYMLQKEIVKVQDIQIDLWDKA